MMKKYVPTRTDAMEMDHARALIIHAHRINARYQAPVMETADAQKNTN
jgi:hypothetical protein